MDADMSQLMSAVPDHIPQDLVRDVDFFNLPGADADIHLAWRALQQSGPDVFWTPRNGGHWIATRAEDIEAIQLDHERFSMAQLSLPRTDMAGGAPAIPISLDPPHHWPFRKLLQPAFLPRAVDRLEEGVRATAIRLTEALAPLGRCEFVGDFATQLPITVFMDMMDLPHADIERIRPLADAATRSPDPAERRKASGGMAMYVMNYVKERRENPGDDLISFISKGEVEGRQMTFEETMSMAVLLMFGGLDTVASMLGFVARFLAENPAHRRQIIDEPANISNAVEELIRRHGLVNTTRLITQDFEFKGAPLRKGDQIQLPNALAGLDERRIDDPLTVDFHRERPIKHAAFGNGPHTCPGAILARRELKVFLEEWLKRIPDFEIEPGKRPTYAVGMVNTVTSLPLVWKV
ncbi:MAG: cytochrome [Caulobacter sp.]|nr:cytochrome [Caulobacter sp.]